MPLSCQKHLVAVMMPFSSACTAYTCGDEPALEALIADGTLGCNEDLPARRWLAHEADGSEPGCPSGTNDVDLSPPLPIPQRSLPAVVRSSGSPATPLRRANR